MRAPARCAVLGDAQDVAGRLVVQVKAGRYNNRLVNLPVGRELENGVGALDVVLDGGFGVRRERAYAKLAVEREIFGLVLCLDDYVERVLCVNGALDNDSAEDIWWQRQGDVQRGAGVLHFDVHVGSEEVAVPLLLSLCNIRAVRDVGNRVVTIVVRASALPVVKCDSCA